MIGGQQKIFKRVYTEHQGERLELHQEHFTNSNYLKVRLVTKHRRAN